MIVLLTLFPVVMLELLYLNPLLQSLNMAIATFIGNALSVAATGFVLIPLALRAFKWWLLPGANYSPGVEIGGTVLVIGGYILSMAVFYVLV
jgi:antibiotic biosynthesis monooxygenase (ABM) superfamily enzyme